MERILSSTSLEDFKIDTKRLSMHTHAAPCIPVSGRTVSMCVSHVADIKHAKLSRVLRLFRPSAKASKMRPNSWPTKTDATFLSQSSAAFSSSCMHQLELEMKIMTDNKTKSISSFIKMTKQI